MALDQRSRRTPNAGEWESVPDILNTGPRSNWPVTVTGHGPTTLTAEHAIGLSEVTISVEDWAPGSLKFICVDGTEVEVKPGKSKRIFLRGTGYHLLDCTCELCREMRKG